MSQRELSRLTNIPVSSINQYIKNINDPRQDKIERMAKALDVDESWLLGYDVDKKGKQAEKYNNVMENKDVELLNKALGIAIKELRQKNGLSIADEAILLNRKVVNIDAFENGKDIVPSSMVLRLCHHFDYDVKHLYKDMVHHYKILKKESE